MSKHESACGRVVCTHVKNGISALGNSDEVNSILEEAKMLYHNNSGPAQMNRETLNKEMHRLVEVAA